MSLARPCESLAYETTIKISALLRCKNFVHSPVNRDVTVSCDNQVAFPSFIASIVVAVVAIIYGMVTEGGCMVWLPKVCNYQLPV